MRRKRVHRLIAAWLAWSLLTPSAWALRPQEDTHAGLEAALHDAAGLEEPPWPPGTGRERGVEEFPMGVQESLRQARTFTDRIRVLVLYLERPKVQVGLMIGRHRGLVESWQYQSVDTPLPKIVKDVSEALHAYPIFLLTGQSEEAALLPRSPPARVKLLTEAAGLTRDELGNWMGVIRSSVWFDSSHKLTRPSLFELAHALNVPPVLLETGLRPPRTLFSPNGLTGFNTGPLSQNPFLFQWATALHEALLQAWKARGFPADTWAVLISPDPSPLKRSPGLAIRLLTARDETISAAVHYQLFDAATANELTAVQNRIKRHEAVNPLLVADLAERLAPSLAQAHNELETLFRRIPILRPPGGYTHTGIAHTWDMVARFMNRSRILALLNEIPLDYGTFKYSLALRSPEREVVMKHRLVAALDASGRFQEFSIRALTIYAWRYRNPEKKLHLAQALAQPIKEHVQRKWIQPVLGLLRTKNPDAFVKLLLSSGISSAQRLAQNLGQRDAMLKLALNQRGRADKLQLLAQQLSGLSLMPDGVSMEPAYWAALDTLHRVAAWRQVTHPKFLTPPIKPEAVQTFLEAVEAQLAAAHGTAQWPQTAEQLDPFLEQIARAISNVGLEETPDEKLKILQRPSGLEQAA